LEFHGEPLKLLELADAILNRELQVLPEQRAVDIHHVRLDHRIEYGR